MAYINKVIGHDEKLIGVAQLHWIYLVSGFFMFLGCLLFGWGLSTLSAMLIGYAAQGSNTAVPLMLAYIWLIPGSILIGFMIFLFYVTKVLSTEVGLTNKRIVYKTGWLFVNVQEIDIEEIRGENLDTGWFGRFLDYGYVNLDCRFIGDIKLPALAKANIFLKALHKMRSELLDTVTMVTGKGKPVVVNMEDENTQPPTHDLKTPELVTEEESIKTALLKDMELQKVLAEKKALEAQLLAVTQEVPTPPQPQAQMTLAQDVPQQPPQQPPQPAQPTPPPAEVPPTQPPTQPGPSAPEVPATPATPPPSTNPPVDAQMVANIVGQVMPQMMEQMAEKMAEKMTGQMVEKGLVAKTPKKQAEDIVTEFDAASGLPPEDDKRLDVEPVIH